MLDPSRPIRRPFPEIWNWDPRTPVHWPSKFSYMRIMQDSKVPYLWEGYLIFRIFDLQDVSDEVGLELRIFLTSISSESGASQEAQVVKNLPANAGGTGLIPWVQKIPWQGKWQPIPIVLLGNPMDRRAWRVTVHRVMNSLTWLRRLRTHQWI